MVLAVITTVGVAAAYTVWPRPPFETDGTPRLVVDRTTIDLGDLPYGRSVEAVFRLANAGDGVLVIDGRPSVAVTKGC
jgi:hypothetical protein